MKEVNLMEIFTEKMIKDAKKCKTTKEIEIKVIVPNMSRINQKTGQDNNPTYWAYVLEYTLGQLK